MTDETAIEVLNGIARCLENKSDLAIERRTALEIACKSLRHKDSILNDAIEQLKKFGADELRWDIETKDHYKVSIKVSKME